MARNVTIATLRQAVRDRGEWPSTGWLTATELDVWINLAVAELYDIILTASPDYWLSSSSISVVSGTQTYNLPSDFYKARGVDYLDTDNEYKEMFPFVWGDRNNYPDSGAERASCRYRVAGSLLRIHPTPLWSGTVRLWYVPCAPTLADSPGTATWDAVAGWEDYIITKCVMYGKLKEESDCSVEREMLKDMKRRIETIARRDIQHPEKVRRVRFPVRFDSSWPDRLPRP